MRTTSKSKFTRAMRKLAPEATIITDEGSLRAYECDAYPAYRQIPFAVVLPTNEAEIAAIMRYCHEAGIAIVGRGAGTSLVGGAMPVKGGIVLGLSRMNKVIKFDPDSRIIEVEAGITNLMVSKLVEPEGLFYAPDPSSQMACTIGGNIAMNSGGAHCLKYGVTTNNLISLRMVTANGEIVELHSDDALDLRGLVCGSEGQLGIITSAVLKLETKPENALPMLISFDAPEDAGACVADIIRAGIIPVAIEYMDEMMIREVETFARAGYPLAVALLIVELEGSDAVIGAQMDAIEKIARGAKAASIRRAENAEESARIWAGRKAAFGVMGRLADFITLDGVVPVSRLADALREIDKLAKAHDMVVTNVFHAGDGNLHPLILYDAQKEGELERAEALGAKILELCVELGGCLTGEHGVGVEKRELIRAQLSGEELELQMQIKDAFDPAWLLNPEKVFPLASSEARRAS